MGNVLITGASRGIGYETAATMARNGHRVFAGVRDPANAGALRELARDGGLTIDVIELDVTSDVSVRDAIAAVFAVGPIDVLVNNAGIQASGSVEELSISTVRSIMETNFFGAMRCTQAVLESMRKRRSGCVINVSSGSGRYSHPPFAAYCASKWALEAMCEALAGEMKTFGVRVAIVEPVLIDTEMSREIATNAPASVYRQAERFASFYAEGLKAPVPASLVAATIASIAQSDSWQLRYPVGPAAVPIMRYRERMTDEEWIDANASDDETWNRGLSELDQYIRDYNTPVG